MTFDLNERRNEMRRKLSSILGEKIEIAFATELGVEVDSAVEGLTSRTLGSLLKEKRPDDFVEHRPSMLICDAHLRKLDRVEAAIRFDCTAIHEAAHLATEFHVAVDVPAAPLAKLISTPPATWPDYATGPRWITHDARFIRALIHLATRLKSKRCRVFVEHAFDHKLFGLSPIEAYVDALGSEPEDNDLMPIRELLSLPMPDKFVKLWGRDVASSLGLNLS